MLHIYTTVFTGLMIDQMSMQVSRDEKQQVSIHMLLKSISVSWMRIPDWLRFQVEEFPSTQASCIVMVQLILPQLWFMFWGSTLIRCSWSILVILCMLPVALICLGELQS